MEKIRSRMDSIRCRMYIGGLNLRQQVASNNHRLSRDSWLKSALDVLRDEGVHGVRVERLARDLGVTKGSFYWHFKDREDLEQSILDFWDKQYTDVVVESRELREANPSKGLLELMTRIKKERLDEYELAIRSWADHDAKALAAVQTVYEKRIKFVKSFFTRLGFRGLDAEVRTRLALCFLCWELNIYPDDPESRRLKIVKLQHKLLTKK